MLNGYGSMFELQDRQLAKTTCRLHLAAANQQQCNMKTANLVYSSIPKLHSCRYVFWTTFSTKISVLLLERNPGSKYLMDAQYCKRLHIEIAPCPLLRHNQGCQTANWAASRYRLLRGCWHNGNSKNVSELQDDRLFLPCLSPLQIWAPPRHDNKENQVSIDHIAFLGQQSTIPNTLDSKYYLPAQFSGPIDFLLAPVKTLCCRKSLIDYKHGRPSTPIATTIVSPTTPATLTPPQGPPWKRQHVEADQSSDLNSGDIYVPERWWMFFVNLDYENVKDLFKLRTKHRSHASTLQLNKIKGTLYISASYKSLKSAPN